MRKLTRTIAIVSLLAPTSATPLGIGELTLRSALNQKLDAEIRLSLAPGESLDDVRVKMASPQKFDEAGIPWSYLLSEIQLHPERKADGSAIVRLSSREAIKEPFLNFLLEVSWPKGTLYREFTVLVDPPATYQRPTVTVELPAATAPQVSVAPPPPPRPEPLTGHVSGDHYGPTGPHDTLWKIAARLAPSRGSTVEQMMIALYRANPQAFFRQNINALAAGYTLKIPGRDEILQLSRQQALAEAQRHTEEWRRGTAPAMPRTASQTTQLKLVAPAETDVDDKTQIQPARTQPGALSGVEAQALDLRIRQLEERLAAMQKLLELKDEQLAALQQGAAPPVTPSETTAPETTAPTLPPAEAPSPAEPVTPTEPAAPAETPALPEPTAPEATTPSVTVPPEVSETAPSTTPPTAVEEPMAPPPPPVVKPEPPAAPVTPPAPPPPAAPQTSDESAWDTYYLLLAGLGTTLLGLLGWLWYRKKQIQAEQERNSMFATSSQISLPDTEELKVALIDDTSAYAVGAVGESSFISEFSPSDLDVFDTDQDEVDPISEADVYLAYGRYQQAEDLMRQAIKDNPARDECKLKLLEIFYANENKTAFEAYARELLAAGKDSDSAFWSKVTEMARELVPDSPIFTTADSETPTAAPAVFEAREARTTPPPTLDHAPLDLSKPSDDLDKLDQVAPPENAIDFDFSLESETPPLLGDTETTAARQKKIMREFMETPAREDETTPRAAMDHPAQPVTGDEPNNAPLDFDMTGLHFADTRAATDTPASKTAEDFESFNFDVTFDIEALTREDETASSSPSPTPTAVSEQADETFDLESFDFDLQPPPTPSQRSAQDDSTLDSDFDFNFELEPPTPTASSDDLADFDLSSFDLTDGSSGDACETKIDLAKAYLDMGDSEAARSIAQEVLAQGNAQQKQEAQKILDSLS